MVFNVSVDIDGIQPPLMVSNILIDDVQHYSVSLILVFINPMSNVYIPVGGIYFPIRDVYLPLGDVHRYWRCSTSLSMILNVPIGDVQPPPSLLLEV